MPPLLVIANKELRSLRRSLLGVTAVSSALLLDALLFHLLALTRKLLSAEVLERFFYLSSGIVMVVSLLISTRMIAEERQAGTLILTRVSPTRDLDVVLGKFLAALAPVLALLVLSAYMPLWVLVRGKVGVGHVVVGYLGLLLLGGATASIGLFASAVTHTQVAAVVVAGLVVGLLLSLWAAARVVSPEWSGLLSGLALHDENFSPFSSGVLDVRRVLYYLAVSYFFLLAATKALAAGRWR